MRVQVFASRLHIMPRRRSVVSWPRVSLWREHARRGARRPWRRLCGGDARHLRCRLVRAQQRRRRAGQHASSHDDRLETERRDGMIRIWKMMKHAYPGGRMVQITSYILHFAYLGWESAFTARAVNATKKSSEPIARVRCMARHRLAPIRSPGDAICRFS